MTRFNQSERFVLNILSKKRKLRTRPVDEPTKVLSGRHNGKGAEHLVAYELYQQGFDNVALAGVDGGYDLIAIRNGDNFQIQVKTSKLYGKSSAYNISKRTFLDLNGSTTFFVFVLLALAKEDQTRFLVVPYPKIKNWINQGNIAEYDAEYGVKIRQDGSKVYIKDKDVSDHINNWNSIRYSGSRDKWGRTKGDRSRYHSNWIKGTSPSAQRVKLAKHRRIS